MFDILFSRNKRVFRTSPLVVLGASLYAANASPSCRTQESVRHMVRKREGGGEGEEAITRFGPGGLDHSLHFPHQERGGIQEKKAYRLVRVNSGCRFLNTRSKKEKKNIAGLYPIIKRCHAANCQNNKLWNYSKKRSLRNYNLPLVKIFPFPNLRGKGGR